MRPPLNYAPPPCPGEALSSWLDRIAAGHGAERSELAAYLGLSGSDIDYDPGPENLARLAHAARLDAGHLASFTARHACPWLGQDDLAEPDIESHARGLVCPGCLLEDEVEGRHQYVRLEWLDIWRIGCSRHGLALQNFEAIHFVPRPGGARRARLENLFEATIGPTSLRRLRYPRVIRKKPPVQLVALECEIQRVRHQGGDFSDLWDLGSSWPQARAALLDLSDIMLTRSSGGVAGPLVGVFNHPDDPQPASFNYGQPGQGSFGALFAPWRIRVLAAIALVVANPNRMSAVPVQAFGHKYFWGLQGVPAIVMNRYPHLAQAAQRDPMTLLLCAAQASVADQCVQKSAAWPPALRARVEHAAAVAVTAAK